MCLCVRETTELDLTHAGRKIISSYFLLVAVLSSSRRSFSSHARLSIKGLEVVQGAVANLGEGPRLQPLPLFFRPKSRPVGPRYSFYEEK